MRENKNNSHFTNTLIHESSPYLLQHAHNPVDWYPWGEEALQKAKSENKLLIISIGYAACHWCHVMEKECYADIEVAQYMNEHFVSIKIDREERPDIDQIYMNASMLLNGNGGWPLNAFALPNGKPFYVVTYLPKENWLSLLQQIVQIYEHQKVELEDQAETLTQGIAKHDLIKEPKNREEQNFKEIYDRLFERVERSIDFEEGGFNRAPKFPLPVAWEWMLQEYALNKNEKALQAFELTLEKMAKGGIYDQIGGGFARYATDCRWKIPHFEKMLYDNGQLISLYAHAYQLTQNPLYQEVITGTLEFVNRELTDENGGFYASLNADSEGEEGLFYVWTEKEIRESLPTEEADLIIAYYQINEDGNWEEGKNILYRKEDEKEFLKKYGLKEKDWKNRLQKIKKQLLEVRSKKVRPSTDHKILVSWNALMMKGYVDAYCALGIQEYLDVAVKNAKFIAQEMITDSGMILRNYMNDKASIVGVLEDYAHLSEAYVSLYQVSFNKGWLDLAEQLLNYVQSHFADAESPFFYYTSDEASSLIARKKGIEDNVMPASNSVLANVFYQLGVLLDRKEYIHQAENMLKEIAEEIPAAVPYFSKWATLMGAMSQTVYEVAIIGEDNQKVRKDLQKKFLPLTLWMGGKEENLPLLENKKVEGKTMIYVCQDKVCQQPTEEMEEALKQMKYFG